MITKKQLDDMHVLMVLISKTRNLEPRWDIVIILTFKEVIQLEEQLKNLLAAPMIEVEHMMTKFIEYTRKEKEKGNKILDNNLI